ncbi:MAG: TonB-dependent receptor [Acidobacteriota bacterium]|nr:TonB-dependent receptor [Acidobacteriota bacterium]
MPSKQNRFESIRGTGAALFVANNHRIYAFGQDDWKIRSDLTLNLGLRYEYQGIGGDEATQQLNAAASVPGVIEFGIPETDKNNFAPRIGFAGFTAAYTFSKTIDDSTNELFTSVLNPRRSQNAGNFFSPQGLNLDNERGRSTLDIPHRFVTSFNVDIPFFNNSENAFLKAVLGGFQINGIY